MRVLHARDKNRIIYTCIHRYRHIGNWIPTIIVYSPSIIFNLTHYWIRLIHRYWLNSDNFYLNNEGFITSFIYLCISLHWSETYSTVWFFHIININEDVSVYTLSSLYVCFCSSSQMDCPTSLWESGMKATTTKWSWYESMVTDRSCLSITRPKLEIFG